MIQPLFNLSDYEKQTILLIAYIAFFSAMLAGCNFTKLTTNQQEGSLKSFNKAYIIINNYNKGPFYRTLIEELKNKMYANPIQGEILKLNELSLETKEEISSYIADFNPEVVIKFTELRKTTFIMPDVYTEVQDGRVCLVELRDYQTNKVLWKGKLVTDEFMHRKSAARKSIRKIFESFEESELVSIR
jgi:hypothetical protein